MWELFIVLTVFNGNATFGGPIVVEGFKTEKACYAHAEKMKKSLPEKFTRGAITPDAIPRFESVKCIKKEDE